MGRKWTTLEESRCRAELELLYVEQNKTIGEISKILCIAQQTVFDRLVRLNIPTCRDKKEFVNNRRTDIMLPRDRSVELAELFGILFGDGHVDHFQVFVNLGSKELSYAQYVSDLMGSVFGRTAKITIRASGHRDVYIGSTKVTEWLYSEGLARNKVQAQVDVPHWVFERRDFMSAFIRGFFDTDGSVYRLKWGMQVSFCNRSLPLLRSLQSMLGTLGYNPSAISGHNVYLTKKADLRRFFQEVRPANEKHRRRYHEFSLRR